MAKTARIIIGANYGDEGKGTVTARYTKESEVSVLNILTNGGPQRGHSIVSDYGEHTFKHFGSGTYYGAANYYSRFFIINPMEFVRELNEMVVKPTYIYRHPDCMWTTPYDMMANAITEELKGRHATCGMGIWNTIKRYKDLPYNVRFDTFMGKNTYHIQMNHLDYIREYHEKNIGVIPEKWKALWYSENLAEHFLLDCKTMYNFTVPVFDSSFLSNNYDNLIFENGQGLLLSDTGKDDYDRTPSITGIMRPMEIMNGMGLITEDGPIEGLDLTVHYVTRPYLTRHGDGNVDNKTDRLSLSENVMEDRTNHYNEFQGEFRYGALDLQSLKERIGKDAGNIPYQLELTHCDEMDRESEFKKEFKTVNTYEKPEI